MCLSEHMTITCIHSFIYYTTQQPLAWWEWSTVLKVYLDSSLEMLHQKDGINHPLGFNINSKSRSVKTIVVCIQYGDMGQGSKNYSYGLFYQRPVIYLRFLLSVYTTKFYRYRYPGYQRWNSARGRSKNPVKMKIIALIICTIFMVKK